MLIHSDPNNMNSIVYHLIIVRYSMKTLHWYFPWATALHFYNMTGRGGKLQQLHCYHTFSDSLNIYLTKNHYENYSPKMVPIAKIWGPGSWTIEHSALIRRLEVRVPLRSRHFLSQKLWHLPKNTRSCVENECCCPRTVHISNVNFTLKNISTIRRLIDMAQAS